MIVLGRALCDERDEVGGERKLDDVQGLRGTFMHREEVVDGRHEVDLGG